MRSVEKIPSRRASPSRLGSVLDRELEGARVVRHRLGSVQEQARFASACHPCADAGAIPALLARERAAVDDHRVDGPRHVGAGDHHARAAAVRCRVRGRRRHGRFDALDLRAGASAAQRSARLALGSLRSAPLARRRTTREQHGHDRLGPRTGHPPAAGLALPRRRGLRHVHDRGGDLPRRHLDTREPRPLRRDQSGCVAPAREDA